MMSIPQQAPAPTFVLRGHHLADVQALRFVPLPQSHPVLASGDNSGLVVLWNLTTKRPHIKLSHSGAILHLIATKDHLVVQTRDNELAIYRLADLSPSSMAAQPPKPVTVGEANSLNFCGVDIDRSERVLVCCDEKDNGVIQVRSFPRLEQIRIVGLSESAETATVKKTGMCMCLRLFRRHSAPDADGQTRICVAAGYESGDVVVWDVETGEELLRVRAIESGEPVLTLDVSHDGQTIICGGATSAIQSISTDGARTLRVTELPGSKGISSVRIRADNKLAVVGCWDGSMRLVTLRKLTILATLCFHREGVAKVDLFSAAEPADDDDLDVAKDAVGKTTMVSASVVRTDNLVAAASRDGRVSLWNVY